MEKKLYDLKIDPELRDLIPPLTEDEHQRLEESILRRGCETPIAVWNGTIVDGHNRYEICHLHNIPFFVDEKDFEDKDAAMFWMLEHQLARRNLNPFQRGELALKAKSFFAKQAEINQKAGKRLEPNLTQGGRVSEKLAKVAGIGTSTMKKIEKIDEMADEDIKRSLREGEVSVHQAYTALLNKEHEGETLTCERCGKDKPYSEFTLPANRASRSPICKDCEAIAKQAAKEAEAKASMPIVSAEEASNEPQTGMAIRDGQLAHVFVGLPDTPEEFQHVVSLLKSAQNYYISAFRTLIGQYHHSMITKQNTALLKSMIDETTDAIEEMFTTHIKEEK